ncbi:MAG TPA: SDR family oxidoreductase [Phycisphaerae bacterium]|nr:SDR family oxidoreductase [Phycisphaerae bacterium]HRW52439.1 SDR family oxidoreductase [Phycisphaerae bacterium]
MAANTLENQVCLVTGGASGVGRATCELFAARGAIVIVTDVDAKAADGVAAAIVERGGAAEAHTLDVSSEAMWSETIDAIVSKHGKLDVLVNCAGIAAASPIAEMDFAAWRSVMGVNLDGVFLGTRAGIRSMTRGGAIVNVASVAGTKPFAGAGAYGASKAAIRLLTRTAAIECADANNQVRVNLVTPGGVKTPMWDKQAFFQKMASECGGRDAAFAVMAGGKQSMEFFDAEEVAVTIALLASDASAHLSGVEIVMDRGNS